MSGWQRIETAPRDGTEIDVWEYCHDPKWRPECHGLQSGMRMTGVRWSDGKWTVDNEMPTFPLGPSSHYTISHWMPVPGAPSDDEDAA